MTPVDLIIGNPTVVNYAPNANVQQQLQNDYAMEFLAMRLAGTATLASYGSAPSKYVESIENFFGGFSLTATGKSAGAVTSQLSIVDAAFLRFKTRMMEGTDVTRTDVGTANGTYAFETNVKKYFIDPRSNASRLTTLFTDVLSSLTAAYQFRDPTALVYGGSGGNVTVSGVQLTVQARMYLGATMPNPSPYVKESQRTYTVNQSQNGFVADRVPVGNILRRQYFKGMLGPVAFADPSDTVFGATGKPEGPHVGLVISNATTMLDQVYQQLRADDKALFSQESMPTGWSIYEPARNGKLSNSILLGNVQQAKNLFDVNYTSGSINTIQITDEELVKVSTDQYKKVR